MALSYYPAVLFVLSTILLDIIYAQMPIFSLTIAARDRKVEVTSKGIPLYEGDIILLTGKKPNHCVYEDSIWTCDKGDVDILYNFHPSALNHYHKTNVIYKYSNAQHFNKTSNCHSVWAVYLNLSGKIVASTCLRVHPTWINDLLPSIGSKRFRDLIIPGTHDSGSYREGFEIPSIELPLTRYSLTQDDTILRQLYQGARYLDIRPAYYKSLPHKWYVNHGVTIQHPLEHIMEQVVQFVSETGEPVIFGLKEFPIGFQGNDIHHKLVKYMVDYFGNTLIKPKGKAWKATLNEMIENENERIILAYDDRDTVSDFPYILFPAVSQNWGNVRKWKELEQYLRFISLKDPQRISDTPVADMAELTPTELDIALDRLGGLRKMADDVNLNLCDLYENELKHLANIIAVDFIKGTRIAEMAVLFNKYMWTF